MISKNTMNSSVEVSCMDVVKKLLLLSLYVVLLMGTAGALACWNPLITSESTCTVNASCSWMTDLWGGWCSEKGCWNFMSSDTCNGATVNDKNCTWQTMTSTGWCESFNCWAFDGTNESACTENSKGINCDWRLECRGGPSCWGYGSEALCENITGCTWGACEQVGCWAYWNQTSCELDTSVGSMGQQCAWDSTYNYCYEPGCWNYLNQSDCLDGTDSLACSWSGTYCSMQTCMDLSYTNETYCGTDSVGLGLSCQWNNYTQQCSEKGCWAYGSDTTCLAANCSWKTSQNSGWCQEMNCWSFDSFNGGSATECEGNDATMGKGKCEWFDDPGNVDPAVGWCNKNISGINCGNYLSDKECMDTFFCWWNYEGQNCSAPDWTGQNMIFNEWNPGCYIFDTNSTSCNATFGCSWVGGLCVSNSSIAVDGLKCEYVNDSGLCNNIPALSTCCSWQSGACMRDNFSQSCWTDVKATPEGAAFCEDYNAYNSETLCNQIAGYPWYMPCKWDNTTEKCGFNSVNVFGSGSDKLVLIDNEQNCVSAGGQWIKESYCQGTTAVSYGRCEYKFDNERNCDKACFACETKSDGSAHNSSTAAKSACTGSKLGYCEYTIDSTAPNGFGYCKAKDEIKKGLVTGDCETDCGSCTYMGDPTASTESQRPSAFCKNSKAGCKWIQDPVNVSKGYCTTTAEKTCADKCDKCYDETACVSYGMGGGGNCTWSTSSLTCAYSSSAVGGETPEICWDGTDNDGDGKTDCGDSECFSDAFCGGGMFGGVDCFGFTTNATCTAATGCAWIVKPWGAECDMAGAVCFQNDGNQAGCEDASLSGICEWHDGGGTMGFCDMNSSILTQAQGCFAGTSENCTDVTNCQWVVDPWCVQNPTDPWCVSSGGFCNHIAFSCWQYNNQTSCTNGEIGNYCYWQADQYSPTGGWCNQLCFNWNMTQATCDPISQCEWKGGFCDPIGFGGDTMTGGASGLSCFEHDGDISACQNVTGCSYITEQYPFCSVNFSANCPMYSYNQTICASTVIEGDLNCTWTSGDWGGYCDNPLFSCGNNDETACDLLSTQCSWNADMNFCQPICSAQAAQNTCTAAVGCSWTGGWCNPAMTNTMFKSMDSGQPMMLGMDAMEPTVPASVDIIGFGLKDMNKSYGFGIGLENVNNASFCNGVNMMGGMSGSGQDLGRYYWYLDTDGIATGGCSAKNNASLVGFEFYFRYQAMYNTTIGQTVETLSAYKCVDGNWGAADIKLSTWKQKMCNEMMGAMVAVEKADMSKFSDLYKSGVDLRVFVATASSTGNITNPTDVVSTVGFATPGSIDFEIMDYMKYGADTAKFEDILSKGYVEYEADCFTTAGCSEYYCRDAQYCINNQLGLNAPGYVDTTAPSVSGIKTEEYPDSVFIMYDTNEPANGTVMWYGTNTTCASTAVQVHDIGILSDYSKNYKVWHHGEIYNESATLSTISAALSPNSTYYYKLKVCDESDNCATSKCTSIKTPLATKCGYCNFVVKLKAPTGWNVSYDVNQDGTYEHIQGYVCGLDAGIKVNYTDARDFNLKLEKGDNSTWIEFLNARASKTALNINVKKINGTSDLKAGTTTTAGGATIGYGGMASGARDKIINNLHPERCLMKIPGTGTCDALWHCNDDLSTCVDMTDNATLNTTGSDYCIWEIPNCEFSTWAGGEPGTPGGGSGSPGGGGGAVGGTAAGNNTQSIVASKIIAGVPHLFQFTKSELDITKVDVETTTEVLGAKITATDFNAEKPELVLSTPLGNLFNYFEIKMENLANSKIKKASVYFRVQKTWYTDNNYNYSTTKLQRYDNGVWTIYNAEVVEGTDNNYYYFKAETPGFSYFAVTADKLTTPIDEGTDTGTGTGEEDGTEDTITKGSMTSIFIIAIVIALIGIIYLFVKKR